MEAKLVIHDFKDLNTGVSGHTMFYIFLELHYDTVFNIGDFYLFTLLFRHKCFIETIHQAVQLIIF